MEKREKHQKIKVTADLSLMNHRSEIEAVRVKLNCKKTTVPSTYHSPRLKTSKLLAYKIETQIKFIWGKTFKIRLEVQAWPPPRSKPKSVQKCLKSWLIHIRMTPMTCFKWSTSMASRRIFKLIVSLLVKTNLT